MGNGSWDAPWWDDPARPVVDVTPPRAVPGNPPPIVATILCPTCPATHEQPLRITTETARRAAKRERVTPELVVVCPSCNELAVVSVNLASRVA
jgi:hypothetical protein